MDLPIFETGLASTALVLLILREVFSFLRDRKVDSNGVKYTDIERWSEVEKSLISLSETIKRLSHTINQNTQTMTNVLHKIQYDVTETRQQIKDVVRDCRKK